MHLLIIQFKNRKKIIELQLNELLQIIIKELLKKLSQKQNIFLVLQCLIYIIMAV